MDGFTEDFRAGAAGIDRDHPIAPALQILHGETAGPFPITAGPDHGDDAYMREDASQFGIGIFEWLHYLSRHTG